MNYLIFSDESGSWHEGDHYVRSWVKVSEADYASIFKEVLYAKNQHKIDEIKWQNVARRPTEFTSLFGCNFEVFITISSPVSINYAGYNIVESLTALPDAFFSGSARVQTSCRAKILSGAQNILFLNFFERYHIETARIALASDAAHTYSLHVDTPQFLPKDWKDIAIEVGFTNCEMHKISKDYPGIELADCIAGCIRRTLAGDTVASSIFTSHLKPKMCDMTSRTTPNPNLVFFRDLKTTYTPILTRLRSL